MGCKSNNLFLNLPSKQAQGGPPGGPRRHLWRPTGGKRRGAAGESETGFAEGPLEAAPPGTTGDHRGTAGDFWRERDFSSGPLDDFLWGSASVKTSEAPPGISDEGPLTIFRVGLVRDFPQWSNGCFSLGVRHGEK